MKLKKNQKKLVLVSITVILLLTGATVYFKPEILNGLLIQSQSQSAKFFESKYLKFSVELPSGFQAIDEATQITIDSQEGKINVSRNGTNYTSLDNYISDFDTKRYLIASDVEKITVSDYELLSRIVEFPDQSVKQKSYYIHINNWVYIFSTSSEELYDELDLIAKSFKYTGEK